MTKKEQLDNLNQKIDDMIKAHQKEINDLKAKQQALSSANISLMSDNQALQNKIRETGNWNYPYFDIPLNEQSLVERSDLVNTQMYNLVRQTQMQGINSQYTQTTLFVYLLILERAKYFKNRITLKGATNDILKVIYDCLYLTALSGKMGLYLDKKGIILLNVNTLNYNEYNELYEVEVSYFYGKKHEPFKIKGDELNHFVLSKFNENNFGLWVLAWNYLQQISGFFDMLITQTNFLNKKMFLTLPNENMDLPLTILQSLSSNDPFIKVTKEMKVDKLDYPEVNLLELFSLIENYMNWFDFHILGINTKDIEGAKERDIAAQQLNHENQQLIKNQALDYYVEDLLDQINKKWGIKIDYENAIIYQQANVQDNAMTQQKVHDEGEARNE